MKTAFDRLRLAAALMAFLALPGIAAAADKPNILLIGTARKELKALNISQ